MNRIFSLMLCAGLSLVAQAQTLLVVDQQDLQPLEGVVVYNTAKTHSFTTKSDGLVDLSKFPQNSVLILQLLGYQTQQVSWSALQETQTRILLSPSSYTLDAVSVSALRWEVNKRDLPQKVALITAKDIQFQMPQTAADLLANSGEVFVQKSQQGGGSPMIRGFSTNRLLIAVDGVRMNTAIFRSGNLQNVISIDPFAVERAEVIFGPGSLLYGSDAIGATMGFQTLTPHFGSASKRKVTGSASTRLSSANQERAYHFDVNIGSEKWAWLFSASHTTFGDLRMGSYGPEEYLRPWQVVRQDSTDVVQSNPDPLVQVGTGYEQINALSKLRLKISDEVVLGYDVHFSTTTNYNRYDRLIRTRNGLPRSAEWMYGPQYWNLHHLSLEDQVAGWAYDQLKLHLAYQRFEESRIDRDFNKDLRAVREEAVDAYSINLDMEKQITSSSTWYYGAEFITNHVHSLGRDENITTGQISPGPSRYPESSWSSYAAYGVFQYKPTDKFTLQSGLRYNGFLIDAQFDTSFYPFPFTSARVDQGALTGSLGAVYKASDRITVGMNASTGFRAPNVDDLGKVFDSEPGSVVVPNPDLQAEYAYNLDLDVGYTLNNRLKIDVTAYHTLLTNALVRRNFRLNGADSLVYAGELSQVQAIQNAAFARVMGLQAGVEIKLGQGFALVSKINWQQGEEELEDGSVDPLRHAAPWFGQVRLAYTTDRLKVEAFAVLNGEVSHSQMAQEELSKDYLYAKDLDGKPYSPAWHTINLRAQVQVTDQLGITAAVENLADMRYRPYSSGLAAAGRNFVLSARMRF